MGIKNIGLIIADTDEYKPLLPFLTEYGGVEIKVAGKLAHKFVVDARNGEVCVTSVLCGIGKVNAAAATAALCESGVDTIINFGLSGGISGILRAGICVPDKFLEHDFDLTSIGYKPCEKPGQDYIYYANKELAGLLMSVFTGSVKGTAVTGDCFIGSKEKSDFLRDEFSACCCDMETAAIASVCNDYKVKFAAARLISDDAGETAGDDYREMNVLQKDDLIKGVLEVISNM